jgi:hypothetical protein
MSQCRARNMGETPYTCCIGSRGHSGPHYDVRANTWHEGDDQPHFGRAPRSTLRFYVEADVSGRSEQVVDAVRSECQDAIEQVLTAYGIAHDVHRAKRWDYTREGSSDV